MIRFLNIAKDFSAGILYLKNQFNSNDLGSVPRLNQMNPMMILFFEKFKKEVSSLLRNGKS